ncbi:MAG: dihydropteroate synthase [Cyclobacteriaceae bacterium]|nr:dihydropteroate synthase [Cyclobacteriaceae bacterium]
MQNTAIPVPGTLNVRGRLINLSTPRVMGILNVTPDSFFDGGRHVTEKDIVQHAEKMLEHGATFLDIGGYSTRPGAEEVSEEEELRRVLPAVRAVMKAFPDAMVAIDTFRSGVASAAVGAGASLVNDISAGALDPMMPATVARLEVPYIAMHMRGTPKTMNTLTDYDDLISDIIRYFHERIGALHELGIRDIIVDPGFGFAKTVEQNFKLLSRLADLRILGKPILAGLSRKSMIWRTLMTTPENALNGTTCLNTVALLNGASILRVHDVREAVDTITLVGRLQLANR